MNTGTSHTQARRDQSLEGKARAPAAPERRRPSRRRTLGTGHPGLNPIGEAIGENARQRGGEDLVGGRTMVVLDASERDAARVLVPDHVGGARITVARLAYAAHVDDVAPPGVKADAAVG